MKDGYYLAAYLHYGEMEHLLYTNLMRHDQNVALFQKTGSQVELVRYWELERFTGIKHHDISLLNQKQATMLLETLLAPLELTLDDMVEIWGTPGLQTVDDYHSLARYPDVTYHSIAHLFSAVMLDSEIFHNEKMIGLAVDEAPDITIDRHARNKHFYTGCFVDRGKIDIFPVSSPGYLWNWASIRYGMEPGSLMALATASTSEAFWETEPEGLTILNNKYDEQIERALDELKRVEGFTQADEGQLCNRFDPRFSERENKISMIMKRIQAISIKMMEQNIDHMLDTYQVDPQSTYLALAGGYALNCPTNSHLMQRYRFKGFLAPPCTNDSGMSLGIGLYAFFEKMEGNPFRFRLVNAYAGQDDTGIGRILESPEFQPFIKQIEPLDFEKVAADIEESPIVWFNGAAEIGPRALGNRSILGDPRKEETKIQLNDMKQRQWWRPVAPIVLEEDAAEWFEHAYPSPYMLHTFTIQPEKRDLIPAVAHIDYTARVQTVNVEENEAIYKILTCLKKRTGVPVICNTSLNDKGEPIINRMEEALNFALRKGIRVIYLNGTRLELHRHEEYGRERPYPRPVRTDILTEQEKEDLWSKLNPHLIPKELLRYGKVFEERYPDKRYDLTDERDARRYVKEMKLFLQLYQHRLVENMKLQ